VSSSKVSQELGMLRPCKLRQVDVFSNSLKRKRCLSPCAQYLLIWHILVKECRHQDSCITGHHLRQCKGLLFKLNCRLSLEVWLKL
jgi:hypothetical protein